MMKCRPQPAPARLCLHCKHLTETFNKAKDGHHILGRCALQAHAILLRSPQCACDRWERGSRQ